MYASEIVPVSNPWLPPSTEKLLIYQPFRLKGAITFLIGCGPPFFEFISVLGRTLLKTPYEIAYFKGLLAGILEVFFTV